MKTAIVTGAAGFIGSHLAEKLLGKKLRVIGIDCFTNYYSKKIKENNLVNCLKNKNFIFIKKDLMKLDLLPILKKSQYLFHEAAQPGVRSSWGIEFETYVKDNILVTQRILECAKNVKSLEKIIIASSSSVYGDKEGKMSEDSIPKPKSPYGATKLAAENLGFIYTANYELPITSLRYFTVYGPRQRPDMAFTRFILGTLRGGEITVYGDGNQTRDFTYIDDIVNATISVIENNVQGEIMNLGGGKVISIKDILNMISEISKIELRVSYQKSQKGDVYRTQSDFSKARKLIGFKPKVRINEGLTRQIDYIKKNFELYV